MSTESDEGFDAFLDANLERLSRLAMVLTLDSHAAEDLLQQALTRMCEKWTRIKEARYPGAYARKMLVNEFLSQSRLKRLPTSDHDVGHLPQHTTRDLTSSVEDRLYLTQLLASLPPRQRAALALRYLEDRPDSEIARILGCRESTVRTLVMRGLTAIRDNHPEALNEGVQP